MPFAATENIDGLYCRVRVSYASSIQLQQDWSRIYAPFTASVEDSSGSLGCRLGWWVGIREVTGSIFGGHHFCTKLLLFFCNLHGVEFSRRVHFRV